jgi:hypothetical protein
MMERILPRNENGLERVLRLALGVLLVALYFTGPKTPWGLLGILLIATGLVGSCPLWTMLGFSTCRKKG